MTEYRRSEILSGLFIVAAILVLVLFAFRVGGFDLGGLLKGPALPLRTHFTDVKSLQEGAPVRVGGRFVGKVTGVQLVAVPLTEEMVERIAATPDGGELRPGIVRQLIEVDFEITEPELLLNPRNAFVELRYDTLLTPVFLALDPGDWEANDARVTVFEAGIEPGTVITAREEAGFEELVTLVKPVLREAESVFERVDRMLAGFEERGLIAKLATDADDAMVSVRNLSDQLARDLLSEENIAQVSGILADLRVVAQNAAGVTDEARKLLSKEEDARIHQIVDDIAAFTSALDERLGAVESRVVGLVGTADEVLVENRADLAEAVRRLRRTLWEAEMAMRKIRADPAVLLFGDEEVDYQAQEVDGASGRLGGRAPPFGQRDESSGPEDEP